jgi:hypothetical protein
MAQSRDLRPASERPSLRHATALVLLHAAVLFGFAVCSENGRAFAGGDRMTTAAIAAAHCSPCVRGAAIA